VQNIKILGITFTKGLSVAVHVQTLRLYVLQKLSAMMVCVGGFPFRSVGAVFNMIHLHGGALLQSKTGRNLWISTPKHP